MNALDASRVSIKRISATFNAVQPINWSELRAAAITIGVREAGRQAAANLPEPERNRFVERVMKRSQREGWITHKEQLEVQTSSAKPLSANVRTGTTAIEQHLLNAKHKTRSNLAKFTVNASKVAARSRNPLADAGKVKDLATVMEKVWPEEKAEAGINLNVLSIGGEMAVQINPGSR